MRFNIKSKKGFTLIELLVVIGILAVLAAITIPSVAGLIDRANVSADNTNANEMTNAMERFASEYELYKQDIASGTLKDGDSDGVPDNMDAAQGRVYNVTKAITRADIEKLESEVGLNGIRIDIDSKYAQNHATAKAVMQNYMKTSSSTFEPKQSDMTYWYNTVTGYTIVAEKDVNTATLYDLLPTEVKYGTSQIASITEWIDLNSKITIPDCKITKVVYNERIDANGQKRIGFVVTVSIPNPKFNDIDLSKIYMLRKTKYEGLVDINNAQNKNSLSETTFATADSNEEHISLDWFFYSESGDKTAKRNYRLAYQYEEDGVIKYAYSANFCASYNDVISTQ